MAICLGIAFCEWFFAYRDVAYGIVIALFLALAIYTVIPLARMGQPFTDCAESLVLIPLYILLIASLPWFFLAQEFLIPAVYAAVMALCAWHIYRKNISLSDMGLVARRLPRYLALGVLVGVPLGVAEYFVLAPTVGSPTFQVSHLLRDFGFMMGFVAVGEEVLFRGLVQRDMMRLLGWKWGLIAASLMFGVMHLTWRSVPELGFTSVAGLIFGYMYYRTGSLTAPIVAHGIGNTILVAIMPYFFI